MKKTNQILGVVALVLLVLSIVTYRSTITRAERFERGQKFLANLNPSEVASITITKGDDTVTLRKEGEGYTVEEAHRYPAKNEAINRFIRDLLDLSLEKEVGSGEGIETELEIEPPGESTIDVALYDATEKEMVHLRVGKAFEGGPGNYVALLDQDDREVYLTSEGIYLSTGQDSFLKTEIVDVSQSEIGSIAGLDFRFETSEDGRLVLTEMPPGKKEKSVETNRVKSSLSGLNFDNVYLADDDEVRDLDFRQALRVELKDASGYVVATASNGDRRFLRISGFHNVSQVQISEQNSEEELKEKADILTRADAIEKFNGFHGSWVYEVTETTADKFSLRQSELLDDDDET